MVILTTSTSTTSALTTLTATLTSRPLLPCYNGKRVDNSDLLEAIDRANRRLSVVSDLVNSISSQTTWTAPPDCRKSARPTRVTTHEWLGMSLAISATPEGRTVRFKETPLNGSFSHGLSNAADQVSRYTQQLFKVIDLSPRQPMRLARHFVNMVSVNTLPEDNTARTNSSTGSIPIEVLHPEDEDYDLDFPPYPQASHASQFSPLTEEIWSSMLATTNQSSMEKPMIKDSSVSSATPIAPSDGPKNNNELVSNNLDDAFDMVGDQQVFKTPIANIAVAMVNLDRLPDTPECQVVRTSIRANLIAAMGQIVDLLRRTQAISYTEVTSDQTHRSQASPWPSKHRRSRSPNDDRGKAARRDGRVRDVGRNREQRHSHDQEVDQVRNRNLWHNLSHKDTREHINRCINDRDAHENMRHIKYDAAHGPPGLKQFPSHLRQVVWPHNFKLEKLKKYDGKENPETG